MCGIFGLVGIRAPDPRAHALRLKHRGPDGFGEYASAGAPVYLGHCRLAILDLTDQGRQPMSNEDGTVWITYNGEVYNFRELQRELVARGHVFRSRSDTEAIVHAYEEWGPACFSRLRGMFALGIWDEPRRRLVLARDRLGIKPLHYWHGPGGLAFASEPKALLGLPGLGRAVDPRALASYLLYGYVAGADSIWSGLRRLLPGEYAVYSEPDGRLERQAYWALDPAPRPWSEAEALERLQELLRASVADCLVSDVPVSVFLSGGIDSTTVASFASRLQPGIGSCSVGFEGWGSCELEAAARTAAVIGSRHSEARVGLQTFAGLDRVFDRFDEPLADTAIVPTDLVSQVARKVSKVVMSGDGGDEAFGGYAWYAQTVFCRRRKRVAFLLEPLLRALGLASTRLGRRCSDLHHYRRMASPGFELPEIRRLSALPAGDALPADEAALYRRHDRPGLGGALRWQYIDAMTYLTDNNLLRVDKASMGHGLEVRVPLLDHALVEFAFSLPESLRVAAGEQKVLLRRLLGPAGLGHVLPLRKQGFSCPVNLYRSAASMVADVEACALADTGVLRGDPLRAFLRHAGDGSQSHRLWQLWVLDRWARRWLAGGADPCPS